MKMKKITSVLTALALCTGIIATGCSGNDDKKTTTKAVNKGNVATNDNGNVEKDLTALELTKLMGNGTNLGNTLEAYTHRYGNDDIWPEESETAWGQPETSKRMIDGMKESGFDTLRIPIAWTNAMSYYEDGNYEIAEIYMDRVETVVNYALDNDMYVIINDHWDGGWWGMFGSENQETRDEAMKMYVTMWEQIADRFQNYSDKLIFEGANEELGDRLNDKDICKDSGALNQDECYEMTNLINQTFVDTIRKSGGNNENRFLLIAGYNTDITMTCDDRFKMPTDTAKDKLLISVHYYTPWDYCGGDQAGRDTWGSVKDYEEMNTLLEKMSKFTEQGVGVIIGEYAVMTGSSKTKNDALKWYNNFLDNCDYYNFCPVLWDCSNHYVRLDAQIVDPEIEELFAKRSYKEQSKLSDDEIKNQAKTQIDETYAAADEAFQQENAILPADDKAVAWIMYQSSDWSTNYCVGDDYDPTSRSGGVVATNVEITGEGTYTVALDFTQLNGTIGTAFSALGISNGEKLFPNYTVRIDEVLINGEKFELTGKPYTTSDNGICTRVNFYNEWVSKVPDEARSYDGDLTDASPLAVDFNEFDDYIDTIEVTFTFIKG